MIADIAPALNPGANPNAKLAVLKISNVPPERVIGIPPPPISSGSDIDAHPASINFLYASTNSSGIVTLPFSIDAPCWSPIALIGASTSSENFAHSSIVGITISSEKSLNSDILFKTL